MPSPFVLAARYDRLLCNYSFSEPQPIECLAEAQALIAHLARKVPPTLEVVTFLDYDPTQPQDNYRIVREYRQCIRRLKEQYKRR